MEADARMQTVLDALKAGRPAVFPTDTVAGLGVAVAYAQSPAELARIKGRDVGKPIAWLVDGLEALDRYGCDVPAYAFEMAQQGWPGPLTMVVKASDAVAAAYRSPAGTIGLRVPDNATALALLKALGCPIAATSANAAGEAPACSVASVDASLTEQVAVFDDGTVGSGQASTVVDCTGEAPVVLRSGSAAMDR